MTSRLRFGLKLLLVAVGLICILLSRYFPQIEVVATVDVQPKVAVSMEPTYIALAKSKVILDCVAERHGQLFDDESGRTSQELRELYSAKVNEQGQVQIVATGKPEMRGELDEITRAVAREYATFICKSSGVLAATVLDSSH